jgi:coenzyme F420-reducing hydrogenase gamma subunit
MKDKGIYVKGCPPVPTRIYEAILGIEPDENEPEVE